MSLDYVRKGEAIKASTVNSIIDTLGGNQRMSPDLNVTTTARGPQVSMPSDYGGPNQKPDHILDVGRYMLSGWPMVKLELGFTIGDCLGAIKYHRADGTSSTPVSAAVVYKNSEDCPTGSDISGYALVEDDFGKDAAAHAAGWVDTLIEDPYPGGALEAQLWKYKSGAELAEVFTNVDDQLSVQQQLSSVLQANGASEEDLSTLKIVGSWSLVESTKLSVAGQESLMPTHEMVLKHGTIDCYEAGSFDYNVVLKASLECIDVQKDGSGEVQSTTWAWKIPLGPDADCNEGKAHSSSVTYGGNEVLFEVAEGEIGPDFSGDATYNGKAIWYGCYRAEAGEEVDADEVWLNLSYDYQLKATKGVFSSSKDSGSYTQDGILSRNVFVVKTSSFKPGADAARGDRAPAESLEHGTWGVLPKDGPKLDTYCKKDSTTEFKSLDWADREGEDVECQCAELHEFDQLETVDPLSTDHLVIRRPDDYDGAELKYIALSSLEISGMYVPPDADVEDAETSSLQTRELQNGTNVEELFQFHLSDTVDVRISDLTSVDIVLRNPNDGQPYVQYGKLCIDIAPDSQGQTGQKSIDWLSDTHELQLYKFDEAGLTDTFEPDVTVNSNREYLLPNEYEFVLRKNGAGGEVTYGQVSLSVKMEELSGDSQASEQKSISVSNNVIELYKMGEDGQEVSSEVPTHFDEPQSILSNDYEFVVRKGGAGGEIDYTTVKLRQAKLSVDSESDDQKSVQYNPTSNELQLYKMHENGEAGHSVTITSALTPLLPADYELVVRKNGAGGEIAYTKLSAVLSGGIELDTQATAQQKSLEWKTQNNRTYAQLYKMDAAGEPTEKVDLKNAKDGYQDLLPDDEEFVIRSAQGGEIKYKNVGVLLSAYNGGGGGSADISVDSEIPALQHSSLQHISQGGNDYYELYGFHDPTNTQTSLAGYEYVVRHNDGNGNVSVKYLSADLPAAACPASFDYYTRPDGTHWLRGGYFQQARRFYWVGSTEITADGMIQLSVSMEYTTRSGIIQGASSLPSPNLSTMYIPLWNIGQDMKPTFDYRHAPMLPRWEQWRIAMLSSVADYEYYGGNFLSGATISGDIIPIEDVQNRIPLLRYEDCVYLMEMYIGVFNDGYKSTTFVRPIDSPTIWQGVIGTASNGLTALYDQLSTALQLRQQYQERQSRYAVQRGSVFLLNEFSSMQEWERVAPPSDTQYSYYDYIWDNSLTLSTLPNVDYVHDYYYNTWLASKFPINADYPRLMYWYMLNTKVGYGVPSWSSRYRHWYGWTCPSVNRWAKGFSSTGISWYNPRNYTYGNNGYGDSQFMGWSYYYDDQGRERYSNTTSWRTRDYGNYNDCWMIKEGQNTNGGAEFTFSRKPKGDVYYLWNLRFDNTGDRDTAPLLYNGLSAGVITRLEKLEPMPNDQTGLKFRSKTYGNTHFLEQIATQMGFDMSTVGTKNTSGSQSSQDFKRRRGVTFRWQGGDSNMAFACFEEPYYLPDNINWTWTPDEFGQHPMPPSDQPGS